MRAREEERQDPCECRSVGDYWLHHVGYPVALTSKGDTWRRFVHVRLGVVRQHKRVNEVSTSAPHDACHLLAWALLREDHAWDLWMITPGLRRADVHK